MYSFLLVFIFHSFLSFAELKKLIVPESVIVFGKSSVQVSILFTSFIKAFLSLNCNPSLCF